MGSRGGVNAMEGTDTSLFQINPGFFSAKPKENYGKPVRIFGKPADSRFCAFMEV